MLSQDRDKQIFYVYCWLRPDRSPYYFGKGMRNRAYQRCKGHWAPKDRSQILIVHDDLFEDEALEIETLYINMLGRKDLGTGVLRNLTGGGDGVSGYRFDEAARAAIKARNKNNPKLAHTYFKPGHSVMKGKKRNPDSIRKMWETRHRKMAEKAEGSSLAALLEV